MIKLKNIKLMYPGIFEKKSNPFSEDLKYRTAFEYEGDELYELGVCRRGEQSLYNSTSIIQTAIRPKEDGQYLALAQALDIARSCNISLDRVFRDTVVDAVVDTFDYSHYDRQGVALVLIEIFVTPEELYDKIMTPQKIE